ncbi:hypothetical protein ACFYXC_13245 [Streptomyces sp. NPDC002701]|uniref:hypothetical protein n=1 Tax=Streptomyces sp. NPDC002701 TaxID=3364661 RepID=UPI0036CCD59D
MNDGLLEWRDWLAENRIARIGMEATASCRTTYLGAQFRRLVPYRGAKRATLAVGHSLLVAAWHILDLVPCRDLGPDYFTNRLGGERQPPTSDRPTRGPRHGRHHRLTRTDRMNRPTRITAG